VDAAVLRAASAEGRGRLVLAVSGGRDSMVLLHAAARAARQLVKVVATFDHGTGAAATRAANVVATEAARLGLPVVIGRAAGNMAQASEAEWRDSRRAFLADVAASTRGVVVTAHTRDDQVETVMMRVLRDAGARGLAGLYAPSATVRPLLEFSRDDVAAYAAEVGVTWVEDPTNASRRYFRNRVRLDLLPAIARVTPGFDAELIALAREARTLRDRIDALVAPLAPVSRDGDRVSVAASALAGYSRAELAAVWPAIAARVGLAMDWRGTERAAAFTITSRTGGRIQLSGGWEIARSRDTFELRRWR
jgi:tRNA(Ile)-lysidine synthase